MSESTENPFLYAPDPYTDNPFLVLGIDQPDARNRLIQHMAERVEAHAGRVFPVTGRVVAAGEAGRAAAALGVPLLRLAFLLMLSGNTDEETKP